MVLDFIKKTAKMRKVHLLFNQGEQELIKNALNTLDLILFLPIPKENSIEYTEENPAYRKLADKFFKKLYRDDMCDIFPSYGHPKIIELWGDQLTRIKKLETYLK